METTRRQTTRLSIVLALVLALAAPARFAFAGGDERSDGSFHYNTEYMYAATRAVNKMDMNTVLKVTLLPGAFVFDTLLLPFTSFAGLFG